MSDKLWSDLEALKIERRPAGAPAQATPLRRYLISAAIVAVIGGGAIAFFVSGDSTARDPGVVELGRITSMGSAIAKGFSCSGYVEAPDTARVGARIIERVVYLGPNEGDLVQAGDLLARLDDVSQRSRIATSRASLLSAESKTNAAEAEVRSIEPQAKRTRVLSEKGAHSAAEVEDLEAQLELRRAKHRATQAETNVARAKLESLQLGLEYTRITSPISGIVLNRSATLGEAVGPTTGPLYEIADFTKLVVRTDVPEDELHRIAPGTPCRVLLDAHPNRAFEGKVAHIRPQVNRAKSTASIDVQFIGATEGVLPGMAARVDFTPAVEVEAREQVKRLIVPSTAVVRRAGRDILFTIKDGRATEVEVKLGKPYGSGIELLSGPEEGTQVIVDPADDLVDGASVKSSRT